MSTAEPVPGQPEQPEVAKAPERQMWNGSAWLALAFGAAAFLGNLLFGWGWTMFAAAFALAFSITGIVRVYRQRATNGPVAFIAFGLAIATIALSFFWSARAEPCLPFQREADRYQTCLNEHIGLL